MQDLLLGLLAKWGAPLAIGLLLPIAMRHIKEVFKWIGQLPPNPQRVVVAVLALIGNLATVALGVELGADPLLWTEVELQALISTTLATAIHAATKAAQGKQKRVRKKVNRSVAVAAARDMEASGNNPFVIDEMGEEAEEEPASTRVGPESVRLADGTEIPL
jgi:hypothetical protein